VNRGELKIQSLKNLVGSLRAGRARHTYIKKNLRKRGDTKKQGMGTVRGRSEREMVFPKGGNNSKKIERQDQTSRTVAKKKGSWTLRGLVARRREKSVP